MHAAQYPIKDTVPYELYIKGGAEETAGIILNTHKANVDVNEEITLVASTTPSGETVTWSSSDSLTASVDGGVVTGEAAGNAIITASITVDGVTYSDTCTIIVEE